MDTAAPVIESTEVAGNLTRLFDRTMSFITRYADLWDVRPPRSQVVAETEGAERGYARANYNRATLVEALRNMLVHRDYSIINSGARVSVFDNRIELVNPCRTNGATRKTVEYGAIARTNPRLHHIFSSTEYGIEAAPRGIPALRRTHLAFTRHEPRFSLIADEFHIELSGA
jgi:predicted HTH transcriptional regulator